jgi:ATP-dependent Clp protease ATP-binding subunit ClpA
MWLGMFVGTSKSATSHEKNSNKYKSENQLRKRSVFANAKYVKDLTEVSDVDQSAVSAEDEEALEKVIKMLAGKASVHPALISESVGRKNNFIVALANRIASGDVPQNLRDKHLLFLDIEKLKTENADPENFAQSFAGAINEAIATAKGQVILFIDEMPRFVIESETASVWREKIISALASGELRLIGGASELSYKTAIETEATFGGFWRAVVLDEQIKSKDSEKESEKNNSYPFVGEKVSSDLKALAEKGDSADQLIKIVVQADNLNDETLNRYDARVTDRFEALGVVVVEVSARNAVNLSKQDQVNYLSLNRPTMTLGHVTATTGADLARTQTVEGNLTEARLE